jgi:hypothetical protein
MTEDIGRELRKIQQYAAGLQGLLADVHAKSPRSAEGTDRSGAVRVVLGHDGLPASVRVESDWQRRLKPEGFGGAVMEAFSVAMGERMAVWTTELEEQGLRSKVERLRTGFDSQSAATPAGQIPAAFRRAEASAVSPRPMGDITEEVLKAFDSVNEFTAQSAKPTTADGTSAQGKLKITLSKSALVSCVAEPRWVAGQSAARLMNALGEALRGAREELATLAEKPEPGGHLDRLFGEALSLLKDPNRLADS